MHNIITKHKVYVFAIERQIQKAYLSKWSHKDTSVVSTVHAGNAGKDRQ